MKLTRRGLFRFGRDIAVAGAVAPVVAKAAESERPPDLVDEDGYGYLDDVIYNIEPTETPFLSNLTDTSRPLHEWQADVLTTDFGDLLITRNRFLK